ncbi:MAG: hypothetical protein HY062_19075 [Bacteroidetes bacterium]|nr:hypothetical protein [Bacteroidota bacterium]
MPKRTDSLYCSHSCRQLAYVLRKANGKVIESENLQGLQITKTSHPKKQEPSINKNTERNPINVYPSIEDENTSSDANKLTDNMNYQSNNAEIIQQSSINPPLLTDIKSIVTKNELPVNLNTENKNTNKNFNLIQKNAEPEYKEYTSRCINELDYLHIERDNWSTLDKFFESKDEAGMWVSERYRCLVECLLLFSEMKLIELDDLKEVCNALTCVMQSKYYKYLHPSYPYISEIKELRERTKSKCLKEGAAIFIKYKLSKEQKQNMILARMELSQFVPKIKFSELKFRENEK